MAFINISNHASDQWSDAQKAAARELCREEEIEAMVRAEYRGGYEFCAEACYYRAVLRETHEGTIYDINFPAIKYDGRPIYNLFRELTEEIEVEVRGCGPDEDHVLMIQGETAFTLYLVRHFAPHFRVVVAVSDRNTTDNPFTSFVPVNWIYNWDLCGELKIR